MNSAQQLAVLVLSGGGAAAIFTLVKAWLALRASADTREATAIANLERWRIEADTRADRAYAALELERELHAYWQRRAAAMEYALFLQGVPVPDFPNPPHNQRSEA